MSLQPILHHSRHSPLTIAGHPFHTCVARPRVGWNKGMDLAANTGGPFLSLALKEDAIWRDFSPGVPRNKREAANSWLTKKRCYTLLHMSTEMMDNYFQYFVRGGFVGHRFCASSKHLSPHLPVDELDSSGVKKGVALQLQDARVRVGSTKKPTRC
ncbi:hypothetical protein TNCV_1106121 [Trichonephila clavipes]|nr:hypothetical protein TNCV_1106121 [Trichonephila clavipes]